MLHVICHMTHVKCHMSHDTCQMTNIKCQMSHVTCYKSNITCHLLHVICQMSYDTCHMSHDTCQMSHVTRPHRIASIRSGFCFRGYSSHSVVKHSCLPIAMAAEFLSIAVCGRAAENKCFDIVHYLIICIEHLLKIVF